MTKTFKRITNDEIYETIIDGFQKNAEEYKDLLLHMKETNGKVKANRWMITTIGTTLLALIGWFFVHVNQQKHLNN